ncbi:glycosyltransferase family 2 protein [Polynucleobacter paneuropaeus]|nr:glycosyltransferase family 2 protein [Polynucleobacter paneuropaeus]
MNFAPIVLFVFNRPEHTQKTIESLAANSLADFSDLYIFCDGPRDDKDQEAVRKVKAYIKKIKGFRSVKIKAQENNIGLANSVINGVEEVIQKYGRVIVVEDDLLLAQSFLSYMNKALDIYVNNSKVFSVGGYNPPILIPKQFAFDSYLSYRCCTWGWGTWVDRWSKVDWLVKDFPEFINDNNKIKRFNRGGDDMSELLRLQILGKINSWGIRWDYAHFKNEAFCIRPTHSLACSSGNDGSGIHCGVTDKYDVELSSKSDFIYPRDQDLKVDADINDKFATFYDGRVRDKNSGSESAPDISKPRSFSKFLHWLGICKSSGANGR